MESKNYLSWKEESFWKRIKGFSLFIYTVSFFILVIANNSNKLYWLIPFGFLGLYWLARIPEEYYDKDVKIIRQYILWRGAFFFVCLIIGGLVTFFAADITSYAIFLGIFIIAVPIPLEIFKKKISNSNTILKYIVDDKPALFSKLFFQETSKGKIILTFVFIVYLVACVLLAVGAEHFHWNIGS